MAGGHRGGGEPGQEECRHQLGEEGDGSQGEVAPLTSGIISIRSLRRSTVCSIKIVMTRDFDPTLERRHP